MSRNSTSGSTRRTTSSAARASPASPTTSSSGCAAIRRRRSSRAGRSSSTSTMRSFTRSADIDGLRLDDEGGVDLAVLLLQRELVAVGEEVLQVHAHVLE